MYKSIIVSFLSIYGRVPRNVIILIHMPYLCESLRYTINFNANNTNSGISLEYKTKWSNSRPKWTDKSTNRRITIVK